MATEDGQVARNKLIEVEKLGLTAHYAGQYVCEPEAVEVGEVTPAL